MYSKVRLEAYLVIVCNLPLYSNLRIYMRKTIVKYYEWYAPHQCEGSHNNII